MKLVKTSYDKCRSFLFVDSTNKKDIKFFKSLTKFFELVSNPTININEIKPKRYRIK